MLRRLRMPMAPAMPRSFGRGNQCGAHRRLASFRLCQRPPGALTRSRATESVAPSIADSHYDSPMTDDGRPSRPPGPPSVYMRWMRLLFLHWPVEPEVLRPLVPASLELDTFDGRAWVGLVPFTMTLRHRFTPGIPTARCFHECNVRTYVTAGESGGPGAGGDMPRPKRRGMAPVRGDQGVPGVWFFSLDAASRLAVWAARAMWHLNYVHSRIEMSRDGDEAIHYEVRRVTRPDQGMTCAWRPGKVIKWADGDGDPPSLSGRGPGGGSSPRPDENDRPPTHDQPHPHPNSLPQGRGGDPPSLSGRGPGGGSSERATDSDRSVEAGCASTLVKNHPHPGPLPQGRGGKALAQFLTERYAMYAVDRRGRCWRGRIWHQPWTLREAEALELDDGLVSSAGIDVDLSIPPLAHCADVMDVEAWPLERV